MAQHNELGKQGEQFAVDYLLKNNYTILNRNWRYLKAEIDIIALQKNILAVIEVKTRTSDFFGEPQEFVSRKKIELLVNAVDQYVISRDLDVEVRFDIIALTKSKDTFKIKHIKNAFFDF